MMFETLTESAERGELLLVDGGICHYHLRKDGQLTIREILVLPDRRGYGIGGAFLQTLRGISGATSIFAKCPADLPSNDWYQRRGFILAGEETTPSGRRLKLWRLPLPLPLP